MLPMLTGLATALAEQPPREHADDGAALAEATHREETHWIMSTRSTAARVDTHDGFVFGGMVGAEALLFHHALGVELMIGWMPMPRAREVPVDLVVTHPFRVGHTLEPYVAAGPRAVAAVHDHDTPWHVGGLIAGGAHVWGGEHFGAVVEVNAGWTAGRLEEEVVTGLAYRF